MGERQLERIHVESAAQQGNTAADRNVVRLDNRSPATERRRIKAPWHRSRIPASVKSVNQATIQQRGKDTGPMRWRE